MSQPGCPLSMLPASELAGSQPAIGAISGAVAAWVEVSQNCWKKVARRSTGTPCQISSRDSREVQPGQERGNHRQVRQEPRGGVVRQAAGTGQDRRRVERGKPGEHRRGERHRGRHRGERPHRHRGGVIRPLSRWATATAGLIAASSGEAGSWPAIGMPFPRLGIATGGGGGVRAANGPRGRVSRR